MTKQRVPSLISQAQRQRANFWSASWMPRRSHSVQIALIASMQQSKFGWRPTMDGNSWPTDGSIGSTFGRPLTFISLCPITCTRCKTRARMHMMNLVILQRSTQASWPTLGTSASICSTLEATYSRALSTSRCTLSLWSTQESNRLLRWAWSWVRFSGWFSIRLMSIWTWCLKQEQSGDRTTLGIAWFTWSCPMAQLILCRWSDRWARIRSIN